MRHQLDYGTERNKAYGRWCALAKGSALAGMIVSIAWWVASLATSFTDTVRRFEADVFRMVAVPQPSGGIKVHLWGELIPLVAAFYVLWNAERIGRKDSTTLRELTGTSLILGVVLGVDVVIITICLNGGV